MNPFPGRNSVLVLDNASVHHNGQVAEICIAAHVLLIHLPTYSPDLNPIEKVFAVIKSNLRRDRILKGTNEDAEIIKDYVGDLVTPELMRAEFRGCGYV
jgi:transposase